MIAFKSISQLEKTAESCLLSVCDTTSKLKICIICKYSVTKTYTLPFIESDSLMVKINLFEIEFLQIHVEYMADIIERA